MDRPLTGFLITGRRGHRCTIYYEDDRYTEAMYAVHKWRQNGFLDPDESSYLMERIAAEGRVGRDPTEGARGAGA